MTIFEWITQILTHKKSWDSFNETDQKTFSPFIINRWLSMDEEFIEVVNYFQKYAIGTLEPREVYKWYSDFLPTGKRYNKYIKSKKDKAPEDDKRPLHPKTGRPMGQTKERRAAQLRDAETNRRAGASNEPGRGRGGI